MDPLGIHSGDDSDEMEAKKEAKDRELNERIQFNLYGRLWLDDKLTDTALTEQQLVYYMDTVSMNTRKSPARIVELIQSAGQSQDEEGPPPEFKCVYCNKLLYDPR